jgi:hypothetical protein
VLCKHEVVGSIPSGSTSLRWLRQLRLGKPVVAKAAASKLDRAKTGWLPNQTSSANITSHALSLRTRVRDFWHRKEEIDPSLGSAKQFAFSNHYLQIISALVHRKMSGL